MKNEQKILSLRSVAESINQLEQMIEDVCDLYKLNHNYIGCVTVSLTEAFHNALIHGNKNVPEKKITIQMERSATGIAFSVRDEGEGFNPSIIPNVKDDGKEKTFPGRGLFLIKSLADDISFNEKGNEIKIGFRISSINIETSIDRMEKFKEYSTPQSQQKIEQ
ncbi:MAG: ATP-binding protein [Bacteroidales bacterium]|nr:ATP-binding protein [Bacteroidales bacterium]MCF8403485.1 ATP-binding protein [Bacteroidales bacterium]